MIRKLYCCSNSHQWLNLEFPFMKSTFYTLANAFCIRPFYNSIEALYVGICCSMTRWRSEYLPFIISACEPLFADLMVHITMILFIFVLKKLHSRDKLSLINWNMYWFNIFSHIIININRDIFFILYILFHMKIAH